VPYFFIKALQEIVCSDYRISAVAFSQRPRNPASSMRNAEVVALFP
jgi:hypothetical protein